jgi:Glycosyltransferase family 87
VTALRRPLANRGFRRLIWLLIGAIGWVGLILVGVALITERPPQAGFDLRVILEAGRRVTAGTSPYLAGAVAQGTQVASLFYSYPPPVAQAASIIGGLPVGLVLVATDVAATLGFAAVVAALVRRKSPGSSAIDTVLPALALAPFVYPFAIALLFGNVDVWFPVAYGGALLAAAGGTSGWRLGGGIAIGLVSLAKLHPAAILGWLAIRGLADRRRDGTPNDGVSPRGRVASTAWPTLGVALVIVVAVVAVSLAIWGTSPWAEYLNLLRLGTEANFVSRLNVGPASQLALLTGDPGLAPRLAAAVTVAALAIAAASAWFVKSATLSLAIAAAASLVVSPISWFHYPVAMLPFAAAAWVQARGTARAGWTAGLLIAALIVAALSISEPVAVWLAVGLVVLACRPVATAVAA